MSVTSEELEACNGLVVELITMDGYTLIGVLCYTPYNGDFSIVIYENGCCEMTILTPDDVMFLSCT